ncbi:MAG: hypothetical protein JO337_05950 [Acidimicrobiales bacterium]|nr:hypothetical protein [Acidimicrobiales bacterium]
MSAIGSVATTLALCLKLVEHPTITTVREAWDLWLVGQGLLTVVLAAHSAFRWRCRSLQPGITGWGRVSESSIALASAVLVATPAAWPHVTRSALVKLGSGFAGLSLLLMYIWITVLLDEQLSAARSQSGADPAKNRRLTEYWLDYRFGGLAPRTVLEQFSSIRFARRVAYLAAPQPPGLASAFTLTTVIVWACLTALPAGAAYAQYRMHNPGAVRDPKAAPQPTRITTQPSHSPTSVSTFSIAPPSTVVTPEELCGTSFIPYGSQAPAWAEQGLLSLWRQGANTAGCPTTTVTLTDRYDTVAYQEGICGKQLCGLALVSESYGSAMLFGQAARFADGLLETGTTVSAAPRQNIYNGDFYLLRVKGASLALVREQKNVGGTTEPTEYEVLQPATTAAWLASMQQAQQWLWPSTDAQHPQELRLKAQDGSVKASIFNISSDAAQSQLIPNRTFYPSTLSLAAFLNVAAS